MDMSKITEAMMDMIAEETGEDRDKVERGFNLGVQLVDLIQKTVGAVIDDMESSGADTSFNDFVGEVARRIVGIADHVWHKRPSDWTTEERILAVDRLTEFFAVFGIDFNDLIKDDSDDSDEDEE